jgi:hypothetical protein
MNAAGLDDLFFTELILAVDENPVHGKDHLAPAVEQGQDEQKNKSGQLQQSVQNGLFM